MARKHDRWAGPLFEGHVCSLGYTVADAVAAYMCHGEGDIQGQPARVDDEMLAHIVECYRLDPLTGRRVYTEAVLSRPKGRAKSEVAAWIATAEAFLPVRFDGWDADGQPVSRPVTSPLIKCLATEEGQAGNTFKTIAFIAGEWGQDVHPDVYGGSTGVRKYQSASAIYLPHGGEVRACTSGSASKDGGLESHVVADEPLALDTPIPTPDGWTTMGELKVGDYVFGVDGKPVLVWGVAPIKVGRDCYRVTFDDGDCVVTDATHRWFVLDRGLGGKWVQRTTEQMATSKWHGRVRYSVPQPDAMEIKPIELPLDPYVLGLWLGDGDSSCATICSGDEDFEETHALIQAAGFTTSIYDYGRSAKMIRFNHGRRYGKSGTSQHALRDLGVLGDKHVPDIYLWASREHRLAILQGLMDSDGYVNERGNCTFTSSNVRLASHVKHLARSLGWRASLGAWKSDERWKNRTAGTIRLSFTPSGDVPFRLKRKANRCRVDASATPRAIVSIEPVPSVPVRCIAVDSEDHLFLAGRSMLPTHNTHLYVLSELREMYATISRNLGKRYDADPWLQQTSTAYRPGEQSVFETTLTMWRKGELPESVYVNHREAKGRIDLDDKAHTLAQLRYVYGEAADRIDMERKYRDMRDPRICPDAETAARYFLNRPMSGKDAWIAKDVVDRQVKVDTVAPGTDIALGFDGSLRDDATVLIGARMSDGFLFPVGIWAKPSGPEGNWWEVPRSDVLATIREAFSRYKVSRLYADPHEWRSDIDTLAGELGEERVLPWETRRDVQMAAALDRLRTDLMNGSVWHSGDPVMVEHFANAYVRRKGGHRLVRKEHDQSNRKIDSLVGAALAYEARADAVAAGWGVPEPTTDHRVVIRRW